MELGGLHFEWLVQALASIALLLSFCFMFLGLWRLLFHPLAAFPGPWYLAVSELPTAVIILSGRQYAYYKRLHDKYGPTVRVAPNELSFTSGDAVDQIYGLRSGQPMEKDPKYGLSGIYTKPYALQWAPAEDHRRQRKALAKLFTTQALLPREAIVRGYVLQLVDCFTRLGDEKGEIVVDAQAWFGSMALDIIAWLCLGETFGCLDTGHDSELLHSIIKSFASGGYTQAASRIVGYGNWAHKALAYLITPKELLRTRSQVQAQAQATVLKRLANVETSQDDFAYHILRSNDMKGHLSDGEIVINLLSMMAAGGETTGSALTQWAFAIGTHREQYQKLTAEIRGAFTSPDQMSWHTLKDLPYLDAVLRETFRWHGSVAQKIRVVPKEGAKIDGYWVPGGTTVALSPFAANHSEENFHHPYSFIPERWTTETTDKLEASMPFSHGPRNCIGKTLAMMELKLTIANLLWRFDMEIESVTGRNSQWNPAKDFMNLRALATWQLPPLWMRLKEVQR